MKPLVNLLLMLLLVALAFGGQAQTSGSVTGQVLDERQAPLPFATVLLRQVRDTAWVRGEIATAEGRYAFANLAPGQYRVTALLLGYQPVRSAPFELTAAAPAVRLPALRLAPAAQQLGGVEVVGQKPLLEMQAGKMVLNVADSPTAAGATALEILQKVPGLVVLNDRISLAGREGITILLDGRPTQYTDVVGVLKDFPSGNIERIEVLTQPGAAYDAAGSAGIINIILKKNANLGTNGMATATAGYGRFGKGGAALDLNHRTPTGLNLFGSYGLNHRKTYEVLNTDRVVGDERGGPAVAYAQRSYQPRTSTVHTGRVGADIPVARRQTLGVLLNGYAARTMVEYDNQVDVSAGARPLRSTTRNDNQRRTDSYTGNLNYRLALDSAGRALVLDADYSSYRADNDSRLITTRDGAAAQQQRADQQTTIGLRSAKADYTHPVGTAKLAVGAKVSRADIDSRLDFASRTPTDWRAEPGRSDHFRYQERIAAAYVSIGKEWAGLRLEAGLRGEQTQSVATSVALARAVDRDYFQLFPSLSLDKDLTKKLGLSLAYGRRIDRPSYQDLNPSIIYLDPYSQQRGNSFLKPQLTHAYSAAVTYQQQPVFQLAYDRTAEAISLVTGQQESVVYSTTTNLGRFDHYSATLNFPLSLGKRISGYGGTNVFYNHYLGQYLGGEYRNGKLAAIFYLQSNVALPQGVRLEVSGFLHTAGVNGLINFRPFGSATVGLQKAFWKNQLQARLVVSDVLFTNQQRGTVNYQGLDVRFLTQNESRQLRLSLSYKFGNQKLKAATKRETGLEDERGRVKTDKE